MRAPETSVEFVSLGIALLTVSATRTVANDSAGDYLQQALESAGHHLVSRIIESPGRYFLIARVAQCLLDDSIDVIITNGGTGYTSDDQIPEAIRPLLQREFDGFGELFRHLSLEDIGSSALQSRAFAGLANGRAVFCIPGSPGACQLAWERLIAPQLDARTRPCNVVKQIGRYTGHCALR